MFETFLARKTIISAGIALILLATFGFFLFHKLGAHPFIDWDEGIYAQVASEALSQHHSLGFTYFGRPWLEKPPLPIWLAELDFKIFGVTEFAARLPIALFALGTLLVTYLLARRLFKSSAAALLSMASFFIMFNFLYYGFYFDFDVPITFFILLSVYAFIKSRDNQKFYYLFWAALGLGVLTKSLIGLLPLPIILIFSLAGGGVAFLKNKHFYYGAGLFLAIIAPWHIIQSVKFGGAFWKTYLGYHVFDRFLQPLEGHGGGANFYLSLFRQNALFPLLSILSAGYFLWRSLKHKYFRPILISAVFIFLFFTLAQTKREPYMAPLYPFLAIMFGVTLSDIINLAKPTWIRPVAIGVIILTFVWLGWQFNNFKLFRWGETPLPLDTKKVALEVAKNYPGVPLYTADLNLGGPAFSFYAGREVKIIDDAAAQQPSFKKILNLRPLMHGQTRNLYKIDDYIYIGQ